MEVLKAGTKHRNSPILLLLFAQLLVGVFTFQDYGMTWDERLYYSYADSIGYAYSIPEHLSDDFNIRNAFGPSADDHKIYGPAYLLLARNGVYALEATTSADKIASWHLVNFITFLIGAYFLYQLSLRWMQPWGAFAGVLLYATQPLLWGHGFINPKDPPFTTIFIITLYFGFKMVDQLALTEASPRSRAKRVWGWVIWLGILIGLATNMRIIAPFIGLLIFTYAVLKQKPKILLWFIPTALISFVTLYITWPYLWDAPVENLLGVLKRMSNNPTTLRVLFEGELIRAYELPRYYLPRLMEITLTEPVWPLFFYGLIVAGARLLKRKLEWQSFSLVLFWFFFMVTYVLVIRPPMYDGFRHFLFILPPVFITIGLAFDAIFKWMQDNALRIGVLGVVIIPALLPLYQLHPYQYTYYNNLIGGTWGAELTYETDYWLTCYKDAVEEFNQLMPEETTLHVYRENANAAYYAAENIHVVDAQNLKKGDYILIASRLNEVNTIYRGSPSVIIVERDGATFCAIKKVKE